MFDRVRKRATSARATLAAAVAAGALLVAPAVGTAPAADAAPLPAVTATRQETEVTQPGLTSVTVPDGAASVRVTLSGAAAADGTRGDVTTGTATIGESGPLRPGQTMTVVIGATGTTFGPSLFDARLAAAGGTGPAAAPPDRGMFPDAATQSQANTGPGRALLVFTLPVADIGGLPASVDFGAVTAPATAVRHVPVGSAGGAPLTLASITATPPFSIEPTGTTCATSAAIPVGGGCSIAVRVTVEARGPLTGTLTVTGDFPDGSRTLPLAAAGVDVPGAPGALTATAGDAEAVLSWLPPADDGGSPLTGYQIFRSEGQGAEPVLVGTVGPATQIHTDPGLTHNTPYTYVVRAVSAAGFSAFSPPATAIPLPDLTVTTAALADATADAAYTVRLQASGGVPPYRWSAAGTLPPGIMLDPETGELGGTPTTAGGYAFTVRVADGATPEHEAERALTLTVLSAPASAASPPPAGPADAQAGRAPEAAGEASGDGADTALWLWSLLGVVGVIGAVLAIRRLRAARV
ncbi:fibronectin type III domain-containing protein [Yinghuangia sp. ASG 101]|uniref:fibronectin type III domain-containing protein n=1 Tax=Yinghuangia sp. ASG 101 TaxID=2896848 RepID=UPI001E57E6FC|nr:fibronectin type III domain-containing protein [Yinghuangia sp. ASG 101]UGQ13138.1 fibronectin type III domain-containing protein [Yinghuangia sp. ASG 101]